MTKEEVDDEVSRINEEAKALKNVVYVKYAKERNPYNHGDIITDHMGSGIIYKMTYSLHYGGYPTIVYHVRELTKKLVERKDKATRVISQLNLLKEQPHAASNNT